MGDDELKRFSQAVLSGIQGANTNAGTGNAMINAYTAPEFGSILANQGSGIGTMASSVANAQEKAAEQARQAALQKAKDKIDPSKYTVVRKDDGGFDFFDPDGNAVDVKQYAAVTGKTPAEILADSDNPFDRQFVNDYSNARTLVDAIQQGDTDTINSFTASDQSISNMKPEDLMKELVRRYPNIYGKSSYGDAFRTSYGKPIFKMASLGGTTSTGSSSTSGSTAITKGSYGY